MNKIPELKLEFEECGFYGIDIIGRVLPNFNYFIYFEHDYYGGDYSINLSTLKEPNGYNVNTVKITSEYPQDEDVMQDANNHYNELGLHFLKEYDKLGLLTKEASLMLKPDNYIEWEEVNPCTHIQLRKWKGISKHFNFEVSTNKVKYDDEFISNSSMIYFFTQKWEKLYGGLQFYGKDCVNDAKQYCQNWLDVKLKQSN